MSDEHQHHLPELSSADERLLDAMVECEFDLDALHLQGDDRRRALALANLLQLMRDYPVEDADESLVDATVARIDRFERQRAGRMSFSEVNAAEAGGGGGRRIRLPELFTVAAVLLIGLSLGLPLMHHLRQRSLDARCANNLRVLGYGFGNYAADYGGEMPVAQAGMLSGWSRSARNTMNLAPLFEGDYCDHGHLDCPGHKSGHGESYAYQWQAPGTRTIWGGPRVTLVISDRNPLIDALRSGRAISPLSLSFNHNGRGQNALASDGAVMWLDRPVVGRDDNIWLPAGFDTLRDGATPSRAGDVFLAQ